MALLTRNTSLLLVALFASVSFFNVMVTNFSMFDLSFSRQPKAALGGSPLESSVDPLTGSSPLGLSSSTPLSLLAIPTAPPTDGVLYKRNDGLDHDFTASFNPKDQATYEKYKDIDTLNDVAVEASLYDDQVNRVLDPQTHVLRLENTDANQDLINAAHRRLHHDLLQRSERVAPGGVDDVTLVQLLVHGTDALVNRIALTRKVYPNVPYVIALLLMPGHNQAVGAAFQNRVLPNSPAPVLTYQQFERLRALNVTVHKIRLVDSDRIRPGDVAHGFYVGMMKLAKSTLIATNYMFVLDQHAFFRRDSDLGWLLGQLRNTNAPQAYGATGLLEGSDDVIHVPCYQVRPACKKSDTRTALVRGYNAHVGGCMVCDATHNSLLADKRLIIQAMKQAHLRTLGGPKTVPSPDSDSLSTGDEADDALKDDMANQLSGLISNAFTAAKIKALVCPRFVSQQHYFQTSSIPHMELGTEVYDKPKVALQVSLRPDEDIQAIKTTLANFVSHVNDAGVGYMLDSGTLLAAVKSGGMLPWDYDADVQLDRADYSLLTHPCLYVSDSNACAPFPDVTNIAVSTNRRTYMHLWPRVFQASGGTDNFWIDIHDIYFKYSSHVDAGVLGYWARHKRFGYESLEDIVTDTLPIKQMYLDGNLYNVPFSPARWLERLYGESQYLDHYRKDQTSGTMIKIYAPIRRCVPMERPRSPAKSSL